jgi:hypothetical protein
MNQLFLLKILISISLFALLVHSAKYQNYNSITNSEITQGAEEDIINPSSPLVPKDPLVLKEVLAEEAIGDSAHKKPSFVNHCLEISLCIGILFLVAVVLCYHYWGPTN